MIAKEGFVLNNKDYQIKCRHRVHTLKIDAINEEDTIQNAHT